MTTNSGAFPTKDELTVCFAHVAYPMDEAFEKRNAGIGYFQVRAAEDLDARIAEADVLVVSGFWSNHLLALASRLRFIQSIGAGYDPWDQARKRKRGEQKRS